MNALLIILWILSGFTGFIFWWTKKNNLTTNELPVLIFSGIMGPFCWLIGWFVGWILDGDIKGKTLLKKLNSKQSKNNVLK